MPTTTTGQGETRPVGPPARARACLVELVLSAGEFGPQAEPALRELRTRLDDPRESARDAGPLVRTGMAVTQDFGKLDVTLRALVSTADLTEGASVGARHLREAVRSVGGTESFREESVRASWT